MWNCVSNRFGGGVHATLLSLWVTITAAGCGAASGSDRTTLQPTQRATLQDHDTRAGALWVALRITLDAPDDQERVHLHAVTYDMDGQESSTDLGEFVGRVLEQPVTGPDLIRVLIENATGKRTIRLWHHDDVVEASEVSEGDGENMRVIERIEIPRGTTVRPRETPVEQPQ